MAYLHIDEDKEDEFRIIQFVAAANGWLTMEWDGESDDGYYTCSVVMWLIGIDKYNSTRILAITQDNDIGGEFSTVGGDDPYFIGFIEPENSPPDLEEIKQRIEIIKKLIETREKEQGDLT